MTKFPEKYAVIKSEKHLDKLICYAEMYGYTFKYSTFEEFNAKDTYKLVIGFAHLSQLPVMTFTRNGHYYIRLSFSKRIEAQEIEEFILEE